MRVANIRILALCISAVLACRGSGDMAATTTPPGPNQGQVQLNMTDFPCSGNNITQVNVQILYIEANGPNGWFTVIDFGAGRFFDLLKLQNGNSMALGAFNLQVGSYQQVRMVLGTQNTVYVDEGAGPVYQPLKTPSAQTSGIKLIGQFTITDQGFTTLMLDFDASTSIKYAGGKYMLSPTMRVLSVDTSQTYFSLTPTSVAGQTLTPALATGVTVNPAIAPNGLMALRSVSVGNNVTLNANLYVLGTCDASAQNQCLNANEELQTGTSTVQGSAFAAKANRVSLGNSANFQGTLGYNVLTQGAGVSVATPVSPPGDVPGVPDFLKGQLGLTNVSEAASPLAAGLYYTLSVAAGQTMVLNDGNYHLDSIQLGSNATLTCANSCIVMVNSFVSTGSGASIKAANGDPNYFYIFIAGQNGAPNPPQQLNTGNVSSTPKAVALGTTNTIVANFYAPYGSVQFGGGCNFTGFSIGHEISIGDGCQITGKTAQIAFSGEYIMQAGYQGDALQYDFTGTDNTVRFVSSTQPQYVFHGFYQYNIVTKQAFVTYTTVDEINPDCLSCQTTGIWPPIATYSAGAFSVTPSATGFELVSYTNTQVAALILLDSTTVTFTRRSIFGPFDEVTP